jgi:hypothetical protein
MKTAVYILVLGIPVIASIQGVNGLFELFNLKNNLNFNNFNYEICNEESSQFRLKSLELFPNPPQKNNNLKIVVKGNLIEDITNESKLKTIVKYQRITLIKRTFDLCEELNKDKNNFPVKCPITKGDKEVEYNVNIPDNIPNGRYHVDAILEQNDKVIFCIKIDMGFFE